MTKTKETAVLAILLLGLLGCGGLRYSQVAPEAKDFHPQRIAVLPADTTAFPEAKASIDRLFAEVLAERKWFTDIVGGEAIGRRLETDAEFRQAVTEYLAKLRNVSYSDPELSARIGAADPYRGLSARPGRLLELYDGRRYKGGQGRHQHHDDRGKNRQDHLARGPQPGQRLYDHQTGPSRCGEGPYPGDDRPYAALAL